MTRAIGVLLFAAILVVAASFWWFGPPEFAAYHSGICGAQMWKRHVLWFDFSEKDFDEFGIKERWMRAHKRPCPALWIKGVIEQDDGQYWPPLQLAIAEGRGLEALRNQVATAPASELRHRDRLGRTALHWLVIHPDPRVRATLIAPLLQAGLTLDDKDSDGLTPRDWEANSKSQAK